MTPEMVLDVGQEALWVTALLAAPLLISALVIGLLVGMVQAATQIQEMTLTFVPKILVVLLGLLFFANWMLQKLIDFGHKSISQLPYVIR